MDNHDIKTITDEKILRAEAAKMYWKFHDFDIINCKYYDDDKEAKFIETRKEKSKTHGNDQVFKLPITIQNEGLMYNPVNMKIEDANRLYEKDLREKNKKARYEVKYDVDAMVRREALAEQDREAQVKLNKISGMRYREEMQRGFNIVNFNKLDGKANQYMMEQVSKSNPVNTWTKAMQNANTNDDILQEIERIKEEEYHKTLKERGINEDFKKIEMDKFKGEGERALLKKFLYERRSKRLRKILDRSPQPAELEGKNSILTASKRANSQIHKDLEAHNKSYQKTESKHSKIAHSITKSPIALAEEL